jgi:hypothetical protein
MAKPLSPKMLTKASSSSHGRCWWSPSCQGVGRGDVSVDTERGWRRSRVELLAGWCWQWGVGEDPGRIVGIDAEDVGKAPRAKVLAEAILIEMPKMSAKFSSHWVKSCENAPMLRRCIFQGHRLSVIASSNTQVASKFFDNKRHWLSTCYQVLVFGHTSFYITM